ncbi:MAG: HEAT repeat domain-containing protein, partial [Verrucomicrobiae bacterium]|nr:HEAT repeat domain-containing protein [Verrucomicrobiae bacterium]
REPDVNVIHGALRRLKDIRTPGSAELVAGFLTHPDEDVLVSAIQTSLTLSGDNDRFSMGRDEEKKAPESDPAILGCLKDPRWRVRANALEYVAKRKLGSAKDECLRLLGDDDDFVRFAAIKALAAIGDSDVLPRLKALVISDEELAGPVMQGYAAMEKMPDEEMLERIDAAPPDQRMAAVRAAAEVSALSSLLARYANDPDADVACAALTAIAADEDKLEDGTLATAVLLALRGGEASRTSAILQNIDLPGESSGARIDPALLELLRETEAPASTVLDPLYDAFLQTGKGAERKAAAAPKIAGALGEIFTEIEKRCAPDVDPVLRYHAALHLAAAGRAKGFETLAGMIPGLSTAQKTGIGRALYSIPSAEAVPVIRALLRDPVPEVRSDAAEAALSNQRATALIDLVLGELSAEDAVLQPVEVYGYRFDYAGRENGRAFRSWCQAVLDDDSAPTDLVVLACAAARHCATTAILDAVRRRTKSADPLIRREAWFALLSARSSEVAASAAEIAADPEAFVRAVLPDRVSRDNNAWIHRFSDTQIAKDENWVYSEKKPRAGKEALAALQGMASADPSPLVRFEAGMALVKNGVPIDLDAFVSLLPQMSKETNAVGRITGWLEANAGRATPALRPLLAVADTSKIDADKLKTLRSRVNPESSAGILTFASLAGHADAGDAETPLLAEEKEAEEVERDSLDVVFFYKPGCAECAETRRYFDALRTDFPLLKIDERNILEPAGLVFNEALCSRFRVPSIRSSMAPAVFAQAGYVIGPEISPAALGKLFADTMGEPQDDSWMKLDEPREAEAAAAVERRFESITLPVVLLGGLLDGINPCAFATIIFFLSYLQIARRTPREMLMVG